MKLKVELWGNDAAVKLPKSLLQQTGLSIGDTVDVSINENGKTVAKLVPMPPETVLFGAMAAVTHKHKLGDLLKEMPEGLPIVDGWDAMPSVGKEAS